MSSLYCKVFDNNREWGREFSESKSELSLLGYRHWLLYLFFVQFYLEK